MTEQEYNKRVQECQSAEELRELSKQFFVGQGVIERVYDGREGERVVVGAQNSRPAVQPIPPSNAPANMIRYVYPSGNVRVEIQGTSEEELNRLEAAVRATYQR